MKGSIMVVNCDTDILYDVLLRFLYYGSNSKKSKIKWPVDLKVPIPEFYT